MNGRVYSQPPDVEDGDELVSLVGPFWTASRVRSVLGVSSDEALHEMVETGDILCLHTSDGVAVYPVSQFVSSRGRVKVRTALPGFFTALRGHDEWAVAVLLHTPADELEGHTPLSWVHERCDRDDLRRYAQTVAAEWSH